jgi:hypothetical protein
MHEFAYEHHDWYLTLGASRDLYELGLIEIAEGKQGTLKGGFSCFTGSMLLAFCAIESFSASVAFQMLKNERFRDFDFEGYRRQREIWPRIELLCGACGIEVDRSLGLFQRIAQLHSWRNSLVHTSPFRINSTPIHDTGKDPQTLLRTYESKQYARAVSANSAKDANLAANAYVELVFESTGIAPRAVTSYLVDVKLLGLSVDT